MSRELVVRRPAERDLLEAQQWYDDQRVGLGAEFRREVDRLFQRLVRSPQIYPVVHRGVSRAVLRRFPYLVFFAAEEKQVVVLACFHTSRDPRRIEERLTMVAGRLTLR